VVPDDPVMFKDGPVNDFVMVTAHDSMSNQNLDFQLENNITGATLTETVSGYEVTISGTSFGNDPGYLNRSTLFENVIFNGIQLNTADVISWDNNNIVFITNLINDQNSVIVTSNSFQSDEFIIGESTGSVFLPLIIK
jgi:hypothetical protein